VPGKSNRHGRKIHVEICGRTGHEKNKGSLQQKIVSKRGMVANRNSATKEKERKVKEEKDVPRQKGNAFH